MSSKTTVRHSGRRFLNVSPAILMTGTLLTLLVGCATAPDGGPIYVPAGETDRTPQERGAPTQSDQRPTEEAPERSRFPQQQPQQPEPRPDPEPRHRTEGSSISPAAAGLVAQADKAFRRGNISAGMASLQRAQRISPDAPVIYYKMAEGYVLGDNLARAEQFAVKGISVAGTDEALQRSGWQLLADIRRARGNAAGARSAEQRASAL